MAAPLPFAPLDVAPLALSTRRPVMAVHDGSAGHRSQVLGLAQAVAEGSERPVLEWDLSRRGPRPTEPPALVVCVGRAGRAGRSIATRSGAPCICLMNPGWLNRWRFDLVVAPRHDGLSPSPRVLLTEGALNLVRPAREPQPDHALVLIGGPSRHHRWDGPALVRRLHQLIDHSRHLRFTISSSRRTPVETEGDLERLAASEPTRITFAPVATTSRSWVVDRFQHCSIAWVTQDSVSMVYEALSAGASLGLLEVPLAGAPGRVPRGIAALVERGWAVWSHHVIAGASLPRGVPPLQETTRVADEVLRRWPVLVRGA